MSRLLVIVGVLVACKGGAKDPPRDGAVSSAPVTAPSTDTPEFKAAFARVSEFVKVGYGAWLGDNPNGGCPHSVVDLTKYMSNKEASDPWGHSYWIECDTIKTSTLAVRVGSSGPDGKPFTADDPIGTYRATNANPVAITTQVDAGATGAGGAIKITATDLEKAYKDDDITADDRYRNRVVLVTGSISKVGKDLLDGEDPPAITFGTPSGDVQAHLRAVTSTLRPGQKITLRCTGGGFEMETAFLADCVLE